MVTKAISVMARESRALHVHLKGLPKILVVPHQISPAKVGPIPAAEQLLQHGALQNGEEDCLKQRCCDDNQEGLETPSHAYTSVCKS